MEDFEVKWCNRIDFLNKLLWLQYGKLLEQEWEAR